MRETADLLVTGGLVVTVDGADRVFQDGAVAIRGGRIAAVGPPDEVVARFEAARTIDAARKLVMPGLIDTYAHAGHGMIKGIYRSGLGWPAGRVYFHGTTADWWYADGLLTAVERVKFGVTTGVTIMGGTPARADSPIFTEANARAVEEVGLRACLGVGPPDPFIPHLPVPWSGTFWENGVPEVRTFTHEDTIAVSRDLFRRLDGAADGRIRMALAVPYLCGMHPDHMEGVHRYRYTAAEARVMLDRAEEARAIADEYRVQIHTHGARGVLEWAEDHYGADACDRVLGRDVLIAHANGLTDRDVAIMARTGAAAVAVPYGSWNTRLGSCPIVKLLRAGVPVAVATDGAAPFHVSDLFVDLHRAQFLQWYEHHDMSLLPSGRAVRLVTIDAARLLGLDDEIGSIEPGKRADLILIDLDQPHLTPCVDPANMLAWYVRGNDVDTTIVDGVVLMEGRQVRSVDERAVLERARAEIALSFERVDVRPYLAHSPDFWQGWRSGTD